MLLSALWSAARAGAAACLLHLLSAAAVAAQPLSGHVHGPDGPLPYTQVQVLGQPGGTLTNDDGDFQIGVAAYPAQLVVRTMGYRTDTLLLAAPPTARLDIRLQPADVQLAEVRITEDNYGLSLARLALARLQDTLPGPPAEATLFHRMFAFADTVCVEAQELFTQATLAPHLLERRDAVTGRYGRLTQEESQQVETRFDNFSRLPFVPYVYRNAGGRYRVPLSPEGLAQFRFAYQGSVLQDGRVLGKVAFTRAPGTKGEGYGSGTLYVDEANGNLHRVESDLPDLVDGSLFIKKQSIRLTVAYQFAEAAAGRTHLNHVSSTFQAEFGMFGRRGSIRVQTVSLLLPGLPPPLQAKARERAALMAELRQRKPTKEERRLTNDQRLIRMAGYDAAFWAFAAQTIAPTPAEAAWLQDFERRGKFEAPGAE